MTHFHVALVPVGRLDAAEIEATAARLARALKEPVELRDPLGVPRVSDDAGRGQHRAAVFLATLRLEVAKLKSGRLVGAEVPAARPPLRPDAFLFLTDVDLYTAQTEGVFAALNRAEQSATVSLRRLREAFYRRKADPVRQRARVVKELLRMCGRLRGLKECTDPACSLAASRNALDIDAKAEQFCRPCTLAFFEGRMQL